MTAREHFEAIGKLKSCPNKPHDFQLGRVMGSWQVASESLVFLTDTGTLHSVSFSFHSVENIKGTTAYQLIIGRLMLIVAIAAGGAK